MLMSRRMDSHAADALILPGLFLGLFVFIPVLIGLLRRTSWFWLPAAMLFVAGVATLASIEPSSGGGAAGAIGALGNGIAYLFGLFLFGYGAIALLIGSVSWVRHQKREQAARRTSYAEHAAQPLPVATLVR